MRLFNSVTLFHFMQLSVASKLDKTETENPQNYARELQFSKLAGYQPLSDVSVISKIDLDMTQILTAVGVGRA
jgi:hypothetical protein